MLPIVEAPELLLELEAARIVLDWRGFDRFIACDFTHSGLRCRIQLEPVASVPVIDTRVISDCERDVLDVLRAAGRRMTKPAIVEALERAGKIHGDSTVSFALSALRDRGEIITPRRGSRDGYAIKT